MSQWPKGTLLDGLWCPGEISVIGIENTLVSRTETRADMHTAQECPNMTTRKISPCFSKTTSLNTRASSMFQGPQIAHMFLKQNHSLTFIFCSKKWVWGRTWPLSIRPASLYTQRHSGLLTSERECDVCKNTALSQQVTSTAFLCGPEAPTFLAHLHTGQKHRCP